MTNIILGGTEADGDKGQTNQRQIWGDKQEQSDSAFATTEEDVSAHRDTSLILWLSK